MENESFHHLALRRLRRETLTAAEEKEFAAALADAPERRAEVDDLALVAALAPLALPLAEPEASPLPSYRVGELQSAVARYFGPVSRASRPPAPRWTWAWLTGGGTLTALLAGLLVLFSHLERTVEIGLYDDPLLRGESLPPAALAPAHVIRFSADAPFERWQQAPLPWDVRARIWIDHEQNLVRLHRRGADGRLIEETRPLADSPAAQARQLEQLVAEIKPH